MWLKVFISKWHRLFVNLLFMDNYCKVFSWPLRYLSSACLLEFSTSFCSHKRNHMKLFVFVLKLILHVYCLLTDQEGTLSCVFIYLIIKYVVDNVEQEFYFNCNIDFLCRKKNNLYLKMSYFKDSYPWSLV